ncbi:MAG: TVP38/TMEM64 family protein [Chloroflexi bacterium]|nr:TVP38/TMEM64 family protein [Chloroflexota bacterium]
MTTRKEETAKAGWKLLFCLAFLLALAGAAQFIDGQAALKKAVDWGARLGPWGPVLFIFIYVLSCVFLIPGSVLTLAAGASFGLVKGFICVSAGSTLGAICAFLIGRYVARRWISRKMAGQARFAAIDKAVADEGWKIVGLTRLSPIFPFVILNYAFGLTRVSLRDYALASWIGMMPGTLMYVYLGSLAKEGARAEAHTQADWLRYGVGLLATIAVTYYAARIAKRALAKRISK